MGCLAKAACSKERKVVLYNYTFNIQLYNRIHSIYKLSMLLQRLRNTQRLIVKGRETWKNNFLFHSLLYQLNGKIINYTFLKNFIPRFNHKQAIESISSCWNTLSGQSGSDVIRCTDSTEKWAKC